MTSVSIHNTAETKNILRLALTPGEPAGIGPDLCVQLAQQAHALELVVIADPELLLQRAHQLGLPLTIKSFAADKPATASAAGTLVVQAVSLAADCESSRLDPANARYVLATLDAAIEGCQQGVFDGMVTGPVHKGVINDAGIPFSGHTEYLAEKTGGHPVMMLATQGLRVALVTTHLPLAKVAENITAARLSAVIEVLHRDLSQRFGISTPRILVCGLNPHAGEDGHLGREEIDIITPVLEQYRQRGWQLIGPLPADTLFVPKTLANADAVLAMYHDQGLPVLKHKGFGQAVNITLGLPIIRTSVDHGTALELAGTGKAKLDSLVMAVKVAAEMAQITQHART